MGKHEDGARADALTKAWNEAMEAGAEAGSQAAAPSRRLRFRGRSPRTRSVIIATSLLAVTISPFAVAKTGDALREGRRNGTATKETEIISRTPATTTAKGGFATRQSNLSNSGGGAVYGCRSTAGGTAANPPKNPCIRANNLSTGFAFEFNATSGASAGLITAGPGGDSKKPFTTNATGVATGLNADRVDGLDAAQIGAVAAADATTKANAAKTRWALIDEQGNIEAQSGGFTKVNCYQANANCYIDIGEDASNNGLGATVSVANTDGSNILSGEAGVAQCFKASVNCGPANTDSNNGGNSGVVVVAPRRSDGAGFDGVTPAVAAPTPAQAARFYVTVTG